MITFKVEHNDFIINPQGKLETVSGIEALKKNIKKILTTYKENSSNTMIPDRYNPDYGNNIPFVRQIFNAITIDELISAIQDEINSVILYYTNNIQSEKKSIQGFTADAYLQDAKVTVYPDVEDDGYKKRTVIKYEIELITASGQTQTEIITGNID